MNRESLKRKLLSYIKELSDMIPDNIDYLEYEELLSIYLNVLGVSSKDLEPMIQQAASEYQELYEDMYIDRFAIIDETGVLNPMNFASIINNQIRDLEKEIAQREASIVFYKEQLEQDLADYEKSKVSEEEFNRFRLAELPSDISYDRYVINNYPTIISKLEATLVEKKNLLQKIYENYRVNDHGYYKYSM